MNRILAVCAIFAALLSTVSPAAEKLITLDVSNVYISDALSLLGAAANVNIITDASVKPERITVLPADQGAVERHILAHTRAVHEGAAA